ncbi:cytochrome P450 [Aspergillus caelatus]|uniref:Cytochrome P450 n=1 Tax=Aspergillus caelatus TaxID=61420 RepID=A0A5N6ZLQ1_9EURO|nr:cytochrome P450 [Aspergillus caelatus]KAE8358143.1 cytochrome P450 [Aspergillus caelatus]
MIVERVEQLFALIQDRHILSHPGWSKVNLTTALPLVIVILGLVLTVDYGYMIYLHFQMPPGPFPLPLIGNTHLLPDQKPWIYFEQLAKEYNTPMITFWTGRRPTIWICDAWAANELLNKRAAIYASRPRMVVFSELGAGQSNMVNMYYGDRWRLHRKLTHMGVGLQQVRNYRGFQNDESKVVALDLLREPKEYVSHFERYATSVVSIIGFGRRVSAYTDPIITEVIAVMQRAAELNVPGKSFPMLMESFPFLAKFPNWMAPWKHGLGNGQGRGRPFFYALAEEVVSDPEARPCYARKLFEEAPKHNLTKMEISSLSGNLFGAGSDTSSSTLVTFVLACCAFPETLPRAWEELDRVVGPHRSPTFEDEPNLPYVKAFVKEVLRWRSVAIIGGQPHAPIKDDRYKGWLIPRNTWVQGNIWAIHHHEREFPEPDRFNPDRYFEESPVHRPFPVDKGYMTFGWGRRVCSGQGLAEQGTFITIARLLWGFDIRKALDQHGNEIPVDIFDYTNGLNMRPNPFECQITPRNQEIRSTIRREGLQALQDLSQYDGETKYRMSTYYNSEKL